MNKYSLFIVSFLAALFVKSAFGTTTSYEYLRLSDEALSAGHVYEAQNILRQAEKQVNSPAESWLISIALADTFFRSGEINRAEKKLQSVYPSIKQLDDLALLSDILQRFGHISVAKDKMKQAAAWYEQAVNAAEKSGDETQIASALINLNKVNKNKTLLNRAAEKVESISDSLIKQKLLLALGYQAGQAGLLELAQKSLQTVLRQPITRRFKAQALGYQAELYAQQQRTDEALQLIEQALLSDESIDLQLEWYWKKAQLLSKQSKYAEALSSYRNAVELLQQVRIDIPVAYNTGKSSFLQTFFPLYTEYIETLLQQMERSNITEQQQLLAEILQKWEKLKAEELQDYFRDACVVNQKKRENIIEAGTAVLYPIMLSDRMTMIVRFADQIKAYSIEQPLTEITGMIQHVSRAIFTGASLEKKSQTLYQWIIAPITADLQQRKIKTLVYLPDGALRKIPFSVLYDGQQYLAEKYALVTIPGLSLLAAPSKSVRKNDILLAGMSQPGPVINELLNSDIRLFGGQSEELTGSTKNLQTKIDYAVRARQMKKRLALPGVSEELKALSALSQVQVMENSDFVADDFIKRVHHGHSLVHIASHGYFSDDPEKSFIMAYDHLINMKQLAEIFQNEAVNNQPVELVSLSACQTASGNDLSPLGLSGVVVQAGVKSVIGTLWPVADAAAKQFFLDFYRFYQQPGVTKAQAMQQAQQALMQNKKLNHPVYWAPFVLVGEWH